MSTAFKSFLGFFVYAGTLGIVLAALGGFYTLSLYTKSGPLTQDKIVEIEKGSALPQIAQKLHQENIITHPQLFHIAARLQGHGTDLKAGEYKFPQNVTMSDVTKMLVEGKSHQRFLTLPEGLTSFEIIRRINANEDLQGEALSDIPTEGTLLPETYSFSSTETRQDIVTRMQKAMQNIPRDEANNSALCQTLSLQDSACWNAVITLASIVEKETAIESERERVAGVFLNRLKRGIALQTDPTVIYAITGGKHDNKGKGPLGRRLLTKDLEYDSPYNTYKYPGLPPGPIANPGRKSIEAVLSPEDHKYIYFVADGTGGHIFAETLEQHNRNVAQWRKIRRAQKK